MARVKSKRIETSICSIINIELSTPIFGLLCIYSTYIVVQCRLYTPAKYFVSNWWNSKNMPLLQIPTTQFSTTIRELNWNKVIFACCWPDSWVDRPRDRNYKICKFKNTYTQDNKQLLQIVGQIHGAIEYTVLLLAGCQALADFETSTIQRGLD